RVALAQINPYVGDFSGNAEKVLRFVDHARQGQCDLVVFPELALAGYPPRDLLDEPCFFRASRRHWPRLQEASRDIGIVCGAVAENESGFGKPYHNAALFFSGGELIACAHKMLLPSYDVFDEERYFEPAQSTTWVDYQGERVGITICEDIWNLAEYVPQGLYRCNPIGELRKASVNVIVNISASPFHMGKTASVTRLLRTQAAQAKAWILHVNQVGGNDELIFPGHSMALDPSGNVVACGDDFREDLVVVDTRTREGDFHGRDLDQVSEVLEALVLGLRDYSLKCGFEKMVLGLSGGVDSALTACVAVLALGADKVMGVAVPGPYNAPESLLDAEELARQLGISFSVIPIGDLFAKACEVLAPVFDGLPPDVTEENLQARLRGTILMSLSNKFNRLLLSTGNKSEVAVGYCTLYGDMNGGLAVLGDVPKTLVYQLARKLNKEYGWIPERTLVRAPSAELRPDQKDQDTLPAYEVLDAILALYMEKRLPVAEIVARGFDEEVVRWVIRQVNRNEYKRRQAPPILRVTTRAFGMGRRIPIAHGFREI
ncbi:MAG: NAD+ synthase, partial [Syntrophobacteraceae bacterium]|nr:NAD+ synthase [Syntrophobacteraceae bacterium]